MSQENLTKIGESVSTISNWVAVERNYQRSMRLDKDIQDHDVLDGYVAQGTGKNALSTMAAHILTSNQRAFTWTGPYGCGKSSLALVLASLVGNSSQRTKARQLLNFVDNDPVLTAFAANEAWDQLLIVGRQANLTKDLATLLHVAADGRLVVEALKERANSQDEGFLLVIDELGKYLESETASENAFLLQEIAEVACRTLKKFVFLGILHQAVDVYASKLPLALRDEWAKVQGRFVDIPLLSSSEETVELLGHALSRPNGEPPIPNRFRLQVEVVAQNFCKTRAGSISKLVDLLQCCWPLNPITTLLLGPISRRKFSQNERSIYAFLTASEVKGFKQFIETEGVMQTYDPSDYWDYLKENFEVAILTTTDSHRWLTAVEAINRAERDCSEKVVQLAKAIALIDLFRNGSGVEATRESLSVAVDEDPEQIDVLLQELVKKKVIVERHYSNSFAIFAGSDFDLDSALQKALEDIGVVDTVAIERLIQQQPLVAREHYFRMGTMRWFNRRIMLPSELKRFIETDKANDGAVGTFILLLPETDENVIKKISLEQLYKKFELEKLNDRHYILGYTENGNKIRKLLEEVQALDLVSKSPLLEGDETGRLEVRTRQQFVLNALQDELATAFSNSHWYTLPSRHYDIALSQDLVNFASRICDVLFNSAPVINNESLNRDHLSTQNVIARKELMNRMVLNRYDCNLGFEQFPPAFALYLSVLRELHKEINDRYDFVLEKPQNQQEMDDSNYWYLWEATEKYLKSRDMVSAKEITTLWSQRPFGLKAGPIPVLQLAFYLSRQDNLAVYVAGAFQPQFTTAIVDEWLIDPSRVSFRWVQPNQGHELFLTEMAKIMSALTNKKIESTPLAVARSLVAIILRAPQWSLRSTNFTKNTLKLKTIIQKANDPIQLLFKDLPCIYGLDIGENLAKAVAESLQEFVAAMPGMIGNVRDILLNSLKAEPDDLESLHSRARNIKGLSGNMAFDAFVARIENFKDKQWEIEGIISLATNKPSKMWTDREIEIAKTKIVELGFQFRQLEAQAAIRGRVENQLIFSLTALGISDDVRQVIEYDRAEASDIKNKAADLVNSLRNLDSKNMLAILTEATVLLIGEKGNN